MARALRRGSHRASVCCVISRSAVFGLLHLVPGGPLAVYLSNPDVRPEDLERLRRALGLDQPVWRQYLQWLAGFLARRLGLQLQRRPSGARPRARAPAGDAGARRRVARAGRRSCTAPLGLASALGRESRVADAGVG